jgi:hypothetical protein
VSIIKTVIKRILKESQDYTDVEGQNKIFDIVLNLNMLKSGESAAAAGAPPVGGADPFSNVNNFQPTSLTAATYNNFAGM